MTHARLALAISFGIAILAPGLAHARGGDRDTTLGDKGVVPLVETRNDQNLVFARMASGKYLVVRNSEDGVTVMRRLADGTADTTFGTADGEITFGRAAPIGSPVAIVPLAVKAIAFQGDKIILAGEATSACGTPGIARLNANGQVDLAFGFRGWSTPVPATRGIARCPFGTSLMVPELRILSEGRIALVAHSHDMGADQQPSNGDTLVARWLVNGASDPAFNAQGWVSGVYSLSRHPGGARISADGSSLLVHSQEQGGGAWRLFATRLSSNGAQKAATTLDVAEALRRTPGVALQDDGTFLLFTRDTGPSGELLAARVANDAQDLSYGTGGLARVALTASTQVRFGIATPDSGVIFLADSFDSAVVGRNDTIVMVKLDATGRLEPSFGQGGRVDFSSSILTEFPFQAEVQPDGYLALFGHTVFRSGGDVRYTWYFARVQAVGDIVEFYNTVLRHYFISYDNAEARGIDAGVAGAGWQRSGLWFRPGGTTPVCRFNGTPGIGPNSHFFTSDAGECALVRVARGWTYEGLGFSVTPPVDGVCKPTERPVFRLYNNRAAQNDSNHRFLVAEAVVPSMVELGWILEGIVFCALK